MTSNTYGKLYRVILQGQNELRQVKTADKVSISYNSSGRLAITCDNQIEALYIDGIKQKLRENSSSWSESDASFVAIFDIRVIAVECSGNDGNTGGILASFLKLNGEEMNTDSSWDCSAVHEEG